MNPLLRRMPWLALTVLLSIGLVELGWARMRSFFGLLFATLIGAWLLARALKTEQAWPRPAQEEDTQDDLTLPKGSSWAWVGGGLLLILVAFGLTLQDRLVWTLTALLVAAWAWRGVLPALDSRPLGPQRLGLLMLLILAIGALFRFYAFGDVPAGMLTVDEPRLMMSAGNFLEGKREVFAVEGSAGYTAFWIEAAAMWLFGTDITGFRMSAALPGYMLIGLVGLLLRELAGTRLALLGAAFTAVCVWPVSFSRQEYIIASSLAVTVAAPVFFLWGLNRGQRLPLVLAGVCLGICFNLYNPTRMAPLLLGLLGIFLWVRYPGHRQALRWSVAPLLAGLLLGLAPLLLWAARDPGVAYTAYFGNLSQEYIAGREVVEAQGVLGKFDQAFSRILPNIGRLFSIFSTEGVMRPWFFKQGQPIIDQATLFCLLAGLAVCLVRFRHPAYAFMLTWWLLGLTPTLLADPAYHMDERRIMLALPATMALAAMGLQGMLDLLLRGLPRPKNGWAMLAAATIFFSLLAVNNWRTYFIDIEQDRFRQDENHANFDIMLRGIFRQNDQAAVQVLSFRKPNQDNWWGSNPQNTLEEHWGVLRHIPRVIASTNVDYFLGHGMAGMLAALPPDKGDPLVILTPFHFYLEPLLLSLGGERVEDLPPIQAKDGVNLSDTGMAYDRKSATRMIRFRDWDPGRVRNALDGRLFSYTVEELTPPAALGRREDLRDLFLIHPPHIALLERYDRSPGAWRAGQPHRFAMADPWFWVTANHFPGQPSMPLRLRARWTLQVPADGRYAFGASASIYTALRINGQKVFSYIPRTHEQHEGAREGYLGEPIDLKAGPQILELEQVALNNSGNFNHLIRVIWQAPGAEPETLPIELLSDPSSPAFTLKP